MIYDFLKIKNATLKPVDLINMQRKNGRKAVSRQTEKLFSKIHFSAKQRHDLVGDVDVRRTLDFISMVTQSIHEISVTADRKPVYYTYADIRVLNWFLGVETQSYAKIKTNALYGIYYFLNDLLRIEDESLINKYPYNPQNFSEENVSNRVVALQNLIKEISVQKEHPKPILYDTFEAFANEPSRISGLILFSLFPQSDYHDEMTFIRTVHISELCFGGISVCVQEATELLKNNNIAEAKPVLQQAIIFTEIMTRVFQGVLSTMPPERFIDFRAATGNASAVQSINYQKMDVFLYGINSKKNAVFAQYDHLQSLTNFATADFKSLKHLIGNFKDEEGNVIPELAEEVEQLNKSLITWRGRHLAFAMKYLTPSEQIEQKAKEKEAELKATGGTEGSPYLKQFIQLSLTDKGPYFNPSDFDFTKSSVSGINLKKMMKSSNLLIP